MRPASTDEVRTLQEFILGIGRDSRIEMVLDVHSYMGTIMFPNSSSTKTVANAGEFETGS